jgi:hypothetical protein
MEAIKEAARRLSITSLPLHVSTPQLDTIPHKLETKKNRQLSSASAIASDSSVGGTSIKLSMGSPVRGVTKARTVKTKILDVEPRDRGLLDSIYDSKGPPSPTFPDDADDSLAEFDCGPLTDAIKRLEGLMKEAEGLVIEAAKGETSSDETTVGQHNNVPANAPYTRPTEHPRSQSPPPAELQRAFLIDATLSELSPDDLESSSVPVPVKFTNPAYKEPLVRDFAYKQSSRRHSGNHLRKVSVQDLSNKHTPRLENTKESGIDLQAHTAYVTDSPPSPRTPRALRTPATPRTPTSADCLRLRKKSVQIVDKKTPDERTDWQKWADPRKNTYFDDSWQPELSSRLPRSRKVSIAPVPWNEQRLKRKNGHVKLASGADIDIEKGITGGDDGGGDGTLRRRWQLSYGNEEPIARRWSPMRKRISAAVACFNTGMVGYAIGDYAGMVPRIQFQLADQRHNVLLGNVYLFVGMAITTFFCWPLPLLHGRKPYILASLGLAVPLQFPQAILVSQFRPPVVFGYEFGLLTIRFITGMLLGLTNINDFAILLDLFGASLQSENPHQEVVVGDDPRREGGGIGIWLGIWAWCWVGSVSVGFMSGAGIINTLNPQWGFYISVGLMIAVLILNVMIPETRHTSLRRTLRELKHDGKVEERAKRKVARGEIRLHITDDGPRYWFQELWAGIVLMKGMFFQRGFSVIALYLGWMYGQNVLLIVLLGALLSHDYGLASRYVGLGVGSVAIGAVLAIPLSHAGLFSRARTSGPRTDSMTFEPQMTWTSHMVRRIIFMLMLPIVGLVYTFTSPGQGVHYMIPIVIAGCIGFFQSLAVAECYGLVMESFDTSDLQPGVNSRHRLQSLADTVRKHRTNYSSFPRVSAGIFLSQTFGFLFAAATTGIGGAMAREIGAQYSTGVTAGILLFLTVLLTGVLFRFKSVQVVPNHAFGTRVGTFEVTPQMEDVYWKPVIVGNPSGKVRRMNMLELGSLSRWTEIRRLNKLL